MGTKVVKLKHNLPLYPFTLIIKDGLLNGWIATDIGKSANNNIYRHITFN